MLQMIEQFMSFLSIYGRCLLPEHQKELQTFWGKQALHFMEEIDRYKMAEEISQDETTKIQN